MFSSLTSSGAVGNFFFLNTFGSNWLWDYPPQFKYLIVLRFGALGLWSFHASPVNSSPSRSVVLRSSSAHRRVNNENEAVGEYVEVSKAYPILSTLPHVKHTLTYALSSVFSCCSARLEGKANSPRQCQLRFDQEKLPLGWICPTWSLKKRFKCEI